MSYCDTCIHHDVCGVEGVDDEAMTYCADRIELCEDAISRQAVLDLYERFNGSVPYSVLSSYDTLPPVTPQQKIGHCKDCKWWKDSDGHYRRGIRAESQRPMNHEEVYKGNGYCFMYEPQGSKK